MALNGEGLNPVEMAGFELYSVFFAVSLAIGGYGLLKWFGIIGGEDK